ncbi:type II toxin-antitoxin system Phd/YefM family antitoxin [Arsukibacterium indicum]|uniref:Type II toxin-antitoxin system Phd/YefM family antitoxin n=1 Tax=Arsukibacterium indicum TaxID=2848612 RepID=A0ABS6MIC1_9GAMM|nr:type II toxin-antitoxin system Phd/YefM family antitoxin [Arsukibacterium indicum]MBV2128548.1 type II toxin-antitoxin system Phd/YefM family antitoxin [Arsukibacterium indicum]
MENYNETEITDLEAIKSFVDALGAQKSELVLTQQGKPVGAILTAEQYEWFLDQLDNSSDVSFVDERSKDLSGSQSLTDFKKDLGL